MARKYSKRSKSTSRKSYKEYQQLVKEYREKGMYLNESMARMNEQSFNQFYNRVAQAKKQGEIKQQPWQYIKNKLKGVNIKQAKALSDASKRMMLDETLPLEQKASKTYTVFDLTQGRISKQELGLLGAYLNMVKEEIYSGDYE